MEIREQVALVTGTSTGIGAALARELLGAKWAVLGVSRRPSPIDDSHYRHIACDLGDLEALKKLAEGELSEMFSNPCWKRVGLVNNAAHLGSLRTVAAADADDWSELLRINTVAPVILMGLFSRVVPAECALRIVNVSSGAAHRGIPGLGDYCASKAALRIAGEAFAAETDTEDASRDLALLSYAPGIVETNMQQRARSSNPSDFPSQSMFQGFAERGELANPEDVTGEIRAFLEGDAPTTFVEARYQG